MFTTGYTKELAEYVKQRGKYFARCESCKYFDSSNICSNSQVTSFDIISLEDRCFCVFWKPEEGKDEA